VLVGSAATGRLGPVSDLDVLIVLDEPSPPLLVGLTSVGGRLTDLLFATVSEVDGLLSADGRDAAQGWAARLVRWIRDGRVVFDRNGRLATLRKISASRPRRAMHDHSTYETWFSLNYDLAQNRRLSASQDPVDRTALRMRLDRGVFELAKGYLRFRDVEWAGEKAAMRFLADHDPSYLAEMRTYLDEITPERRMARYEDLVERTLSPFGGIWEPRQTWFQFRPGIEASPELIGEAAAFWKALISD
jgi:hypothetical protein